MEQRGVKTVGRAEKGVEGGSKGREGAGMYLRLAAARVAESWRWMADMAVRSRKYSPHINNDAREYILCAEIFVQCAENL